MLSFSKGKQIGYFSGDKKSKLNNDKLYLYQPKTKNEKPHIMTNDVNVLIDKYLMTLKLQHNQKIELKKAILAQQEPRTLKLTEYYYSAKEAMLNIQSKELQIMDNDDTIFQLVPTLGEHAIITAFGPSGAGKSTFVRKYCLEYRKLDPKIEIFLVSNVGEDEAFDSGFNPKIKRIRLDDEIVEDPLKPEEFANSVIIFDDYNCITDIKIRKAVKQFIDEVLETGRHNKIVSICTFHTILANKDTKVLHTQNTLAVFFPRANFASVKNYLKRYVDYDKEQIAHFKRMGLNSRWVAMTKTYPNLVTSEKEIIIM